MRKIAPYILSTYSFIFSSTLDKLLKVGYEMDDSQPIPSFEENLLIDLCSEVEEILEKEDNILLLNGDFIIVGDIHGSFHDLLRILKFIQENQSKVLFLGDYVDRGSFSLECITILFAMKAMYPESVYLIRGNHEFDSLCSQYGFKDEIINYHNPKKQACIFKNPQKQGLSQAKSEDMQIYIDNYDANYNDINCYNYTENLYTAFIRSFSYLPIAVIINNTTFCIHGGLSQKLDQVDNLYKIKRPIDTFEDNKLLSDVIWSDPSLAPNCMYVPNPRGRGNLFNKQAVANFLKSNSLKRMIRAHECVEHGIFNNFDNKCITVFSASAYDIINPNKSGILQLFQKDDKIKTTSFPPLPRLQKSETTYYKVQSLYNTEKKNHVCFSLLHPKLISSFPSSRMVQIKSARISSDGFLPNLKPKFTTNRRLSLNYNKTEPLINSRNMAQSCSTPDYLPKSLSSYSEISISDNEIK